MTIEFITNEEIYHKVILDAIPKSRKFLWIATADIKNLHIHRGKKMLPFLACLSELIENGVSIRLLHAKEPGQSFRDDFDRFPNLIDGMERLLCPRVHFKSVIVDGNFVYSGSANLTGAGMGAKSVDRRNFESGIITTETELIGHVMDQFDQVWMGQYCDRCGRKEYCADFSDVTESI